MITIMHTTSLSRLGRRRRMFFVTALAAVMAAGLTVPFFSCKNESVSDPPQEPEGTGQEEGSPLLTAFTLMYDSGSADIAKYDPASGILTYEINAESGHTKMFAKAAAAEGAVLKMSATRGASGAGSMADFSAEGSLADIPLPEAGADTIIEVEVKKGAEAKTWRWTVKAAIAELGALSVTFKNGGAELITFSGKTAEYYVKIENADAGKTVVLKPGLAGGQAITASKDKKPLKALSDGSFEVIAPSAGDTSVQISLHVSSIAGGSAYKITLIAPQAQTVNDYSLQTLELRWAANENDLIQNFNKTVSGYSVNVDNKTRAAALLTAAATSALAKITLWYDSGAPVRTDVSGSLTTAVSLPAAGAGQPLEIHVKVARPDGGGAKIYTITVNPYVEQKSTWNGTVTNAVAGGSAFTILGLTARDAAGQVMAATLQTTTATTSTDWAFTTAASYEPKYFFVTLYDGANNKEYVSGELPYPGGGKTGIALTVTDVGRLLNNANEFINAMTGGGSGGGAGGSGGGGSAGAGGAGGSGSGSGAGGAGGAGGGKSEDVALAGDIDLGSATTAWDGPENYNGHFYGNGYAVVNLKLSTATASNGTVGFFKSLTDGALVENAVINVSTLDKTGTISTISFGGVAGRASGNVTIRNVKVSGNFEFANFDSHFNIGGLVGSAGSETATSASKSVLTIENCVSEMGISIPSGDSSANNTGVAAGLVGKVEIWSTLNIKNSYTTGDIHIVNGVANSANLTSGNRKFFAGGLVGSLAYYNPVFHVTNNPNPDVNSVGSSILNIENCYAAGNVIIDNTNRQAYYWKMSVDDQRIIAGGLVGVRQNAGVVNIKNSVALGEKVLAIIPEAAAEPKAVIIPAGPDANAPDPAKPYCVRLPDQNALWDAASEAASYRWFATADPLPARAYAGESGRIIGAHGESPTPDNPPRNVAVFQNNLARIDMLTGFDAAAAPALVAGDANQKEGLGKTAAELATKAAWTALGFSEAVWDFSGLSQGKWPTLR